ncbi:MAG: hypothetical protein JSV03_11580, partial [Planctomycetota bacterium]
DAGDKYNIQRWRKKLDEIFGTGDYTGQLLEAIQHASAIVPRFTNLIHDRSNRYMPQFGLPLIHYLEMPTLSSYPSGNKTSADILTPQALTCNKVWANQDWGEQIASIRQQVGNNTPASATLPSTIAQEIREHVNICRSRLTGLRHITPASPDQADNLSLLLDRIELNTVLGEHLYHKINAAIAWQRHQTNGGRIIDCTKPLEKSVEAWRTTVRLAEKLFPEPVRYWQSQIVSVPPWTQGQISKSYRLIQGHWRDQLRPFERELNLIHQSLSSQHAQADPPLWDILSAAEKQKLLPILTISFDIINDNRIRLHKGAILTDDNNLIAGRKNSLFADTRQFDDNSWHIVATTNPQTATLLSYRPYQITFAYRIIDRGQGDPAPFAVGLMPEGGGEKIGENRAWGAPNGHGGWRIIKTPTLEHDNYVVFFAVRGRAAISIDMLNIETILK